MSLKGRLLAAALTAVTVFSSAFAGTVNAAEPVIPDLSVQEVSAAGASAEEPAQAEETAGEESIQEEGSAH